MKQLALVILAALQLVTAQSPAAGAAPRCDAARDGWRPQSRVACYKSCMQLQIRVWCNSWCDRHCKR